MANKYTDAVFNAKLPGVTKAVLWVLAWRADANGTCYPGYSRIAVDSGFSYDTVKRAIKDLINREVISVIGSQPVKDGAEKATHVYRIHLKQLEALRTGRGQNPGLPTPSDGEHRAQILGAERPANTSLNSSNETRPNDDVCPQDSRQNMETQLRQILYLSGKPDCLQSLKQSETFLLEAAAYAAQHPYWQRLKGQEFKNFVWACQKEGGLLDQFERDRKKAKSNSRVPVSAPTARTAEGERCVNVGGQFLVGEEFEDEEIWRPGDDGVCDACDVHVWTDFSHVVQQCSGCGKFRTNPAVTQWTEEDELEAEYMALVEVYDPYDPYWPKDERPNHCCW